MQNLNEGKKVSSLFLDISKAFDSVQHTVLLNVMFDCGIRWVAYDWFKTYLMDRKQCVKLGSFRSTWEVIKTGVPQGTVLGPVQFLIYVNSLCEGNFQGKLYSFADDTALTYVSSNFEENKSAMEEDLNKLNSWFSKNKMF